MTEERITHHPFWDPFEYYARVLKEGGAALEEFNTNAQTLERWRSFLVAESDNDQDRRLMQLEFGIRQFIGGFACAHRDAPELVADTIITATANILGSCLGHACRMSGRPVDVALLQIIDRLREQATPAIESTEVN